MNRSYEMPTDLPVIINVSGGRSSAYMLHKILEHNGGLPENCHAVFENTGCEHPATYDFVDAMSRNWGVDITWLEFWIDRTARGVKGEPAYKHRVVDHATADRNMEPFRQCIEARSMLPNRRTRFCTSELKLLTLQRWCVREMGYKKWHTALGIRADEGKRFERIESNSKTLKHEMSRLFPLVYDGVFKKQIDDFWESNTFDLGIPSTLSNCLFCFMKRKKQVAHTVRLLPDIASQVSELEKSVPGDRTFFDISMDEIIANANMEDELDFGEEWEGVDCFCGS